jgi:hypothetical protein
MSTAGAARILRSRRQCTPRPDARSAETTIVLLALVAITASASAQTASPGHPTTDAEKVADALRAGPDFLTRNATILDWPSAPGHDYRVLRKGTTEWSCLPGSPGIPQHEPGCFDRVFLQWIKDGLAGRTARIDGIGIAYMYGGAWVPHQNAPNESPEKYFHVGPHIMVVSPHQDEMAAVSRDAASGMPYLNHLPRQTDVFVVIPIRQWDEKPR